MTTVQRPDSMAQPSARTFPLAQLVDLLRQGSVRVPHFQRGLRWKTADAVSLLDSVLRGFPIGSLLLWRQRAAAGEVRLGGVVIHAPEQTEALYVVDGQQRVTTFLNVFDAKCGREGDFALVYDLKQRPFRVRARRRRDSDEHVIPLPVLFELKEVLRWVGDHPEYADYVDEINGATQRLREFHVPAYIVSSEDDKVLREIYDRMNSSGKRLSRAEVFRGLFARRESDSPGTDLAVISQDIKERLQWGTIDQDTVLQAFLARRGADTYRDIHLEFGRERRKESDFPSEDQSGAQQATLEALESAIRFLREEVGVPHFTFLAYRYLLVVLTRFFAHFPEPQPRNRELLIRWYWKAALVGPAGNTTGVARELMKCVTPGAESTSVQNLREQASKKPQYFPNINSFRANSAAGRIMLCALWALRGQSPDTGEPFDSSDLVEEIGDRSSPGAACPEIFARNSLPQGLRNSLGNRVIMPGIPSEVVNHPMRWEEGVRQSHRLGPGKDPEKLVFERGEELNAYIKSFLESRMQEGLDHSAPLDSYDFDDEDDIPESETW